MPDDLSKLDESKLVDFFTGDAEKRARYLNDPVLRHRWTSDSHFIRCGMQHYMAHLDKEIARLRR